MSTSTADFEQLQGELDQGGVTAAIDGLIQRLREKKSYHELFEALKMKVRHSLGLPLTYGDAGDDLSPELRTRLEDGLIDACRDVGMRLLDEGQVREGWMYLRPVGDRQAAAEALAKIEIDEDNVEEVVEVALHEGVDPARGFSLVLEHYGTCNAITTFESALHQHARKDQQAAAGLLVAHIHEELTATVKADIAQQQGTEPAENTLRELVADRDWLFSENSYHIDTTHLASAVRFARMLEDEQQLRLALDLTEYGRHLSSQFQYQGEEPFPEHYSSHALYLQALLGENVDEAVDYFRGRAETLDIDEHGTVAIEVYIDLLARLERYAEAIDATLSLLPGDRQTMGIAPSLLGTVAAVGQLRARHRSLPKSRQPAGLRDLPARFTVRRLTSNSRGPAMHPLSRRSFRRCRRRELCFAAVAESRGLRKRSCLVGRGGATPAAIVVWRCDTIDAVGGRIARPLDERAPEVATLVAGFLAPARSSAFAGAFARSARRRETTRCRAAACALRGRAGHRDRGVFA